MRSPFFVTFAIVVLLAAPAYYLYARNSQDNTGALHAADRYLRATYARNFRNVYRSLADADRRAADEAAFTQERGSFTGFTARLAARLATFIEARSIETSVAASDVALKLKVRVPDPAALSPMVLGWDEERLNALPVAEQNALLANIERMRASGKLPFVEAEERLVLVRENGTWKIRLAAAETVHVQVRFKIPGNAPLIVDSEPKELSFKPGEPFSFSLRVRNSSAKPLRASVAHNVEPDMMAKYMGLGNCGTFVPFRLRPNATRETRDTFLVWTDIPADTKQFTMIYEFKMEEP